MHAPLPIRIAHTQPCLTLGENVSIARVDMSAITMHAPGSATLKIISLNKKTARLAAIVVRDATDGASSSRPAMYSIDAAAAPSPAHGAHGGKYAMPFLRVAHG